LPVLTILSFYYESVEKPPSLHLYRVSDFFALGGGGDKGQLITLMYYHLLRYEESSFRYIINIPGFSGSSLHTGSSWHGEQVNDIYVHNQNFGTDIRIPKSELWIGLPARPVKAGLWLEEQCDNIIQKLS
jgi:hypothetical protein